MNSENACLPKTPGHLPQAQLGIILKCQVHFLQVKFQKVELILVLELVVVQISQTLARAVNSPLRRLPGVGYLMMKPRLVLGISPLAEHTLCALLTLHFGAMRTSHAMSVHLISPNLTKQPRNAMLVHLIPSIQSCPKTVSVTIVPYAEITSTIISRLRNANPLKYAKTTKFSTKQPENARV